MLELLKKPVRTGLEAIGVSVGRVRREPYQELWEVPRFQEHTVTLLGRPFTIADSRSFFFSYREIFVQEIYKFDTKRHSPRVIDCGSNYGTSIVYFKHVYPEARVTGVEADPAIFQILSRNCAGLSGVDLRQVAVSDSAAPLTFYCEGSDGGRAAHEIAEAGRVVTVQATTLDELIGDEPVDFLKIDIEGSEYPSLAVCSKLHLVDQMFIEYHSFADKQQCLHDLLQLLNAAGFRYYIHHQFCSPRPLTEDQLQLGMDLQLNIFAKRAQ